MNISEEIAETLLHLVREDRVHDAILETTTGKMHFCRSAFGNVIVVVEKDGDAVIDDDEIPDMVWTYVMTSAYIVVSAEDVKLELPVFDQGVTVTVHVKDEESM